MAQGRHHKGGRRMKKLKSKHGETLTETLVSILIIAMASALLATMVGVSARLTKRAEAADAQFYEELSAAEAGRGEDGDATITLTVGGSSGELPVVIYGGSGELKSYRLAGGEVAP